MFGFIILAVSLSMTSLTESRMVPHRRGSHVDIQPLVHPRRARCAVDVESLIHPCHVGSMGLEEFDQGIHQGRFIPDLHGLYELQEEALDWRRSLHMGNTSVSEQTCLSFVRKNDETLHGVLEDWLSMNESSSVLEDRLRAIQTAFRSYLVAIQLLNKTQSNLRDRLVIFEGDFHNRVSTYHSLIDSISTYLCSLQQQGVSQDYEEAYVLASAQPCTDVEDTILQSITIANVISTSVEFLISKYEGLGNLITSFA